MGADWAIYLALAAIVAGTALQQNAQYRANKKASQIQNQAAYELNQAQDKINSAIKSQTEEFQTENRQKKQDEIASEQAQTMKDNVAESQAIRDEQQETQGNVSEDYKEARNNAQDKTKAAANAFAELTARLQSANALRRNENFGLKRAANEIAGIGRDAQGLYTVRQSQAKDALNSHQAQKNLGQLMQLAGTIYMGGAGAGLWGGASAAGGAAGGAASSGSMAATPALTSASAAGNTAATSAIAANKAALAAKGVGGFNAFNNAAALGSAATLFPNSVQRR